MILIFCKGYFSRRKVLKNFNSDWSSEFSYENFEHKNIVEVKEDILKDSYEALTRLYQKETRRGKIAKQKKQCWI